MSRPRAHAAATGSPARAQPPSELAPGPLGAEPAPGPLGAEPAPLALGAILLYAAPMAGLGFMELLSSMYLMKYATDVLGVAPAAMGSIFLISRLCGAFCDPVAGFLSDRTRTRLGRRRPWLLAAALPLAAAFALMWSAPAGLGPRELTLWMTATVVLFQIATNVYAMPHDALGAELATGYHDRTRLFGVRRLVFGLGALAVFAAVGRLAASPAPREAAADIALVAAAIALLLMLAMGWAIRERPEHQGRGGQRPLQALADVWRNPHALLLLLVFFGQQLGVGALAIMAAYHTEYVLGAPQALPAVLGSFFLVSIVSVPIWLRLGSRFEKKPLLLASMLLVCLAVGGMFFVQRGDMLTMVVLAAIGGAAGGGADVFLPSLQADVIDWDEHRTGERKEGVYFAAWNFVARTAVGLAGVAAGLALGASGFAPNREQGEATLLVIRGFMSGLPLLCFGLGALLFLRFVPTRASHAEIRRLLASRAAASPAAATPASP